METMNKIKQWIIDKSKFVFNLKDDELFRISFIFVFSLTGFCLALAGSIVGTWGVKMEYFALFLTNQINLMIAVYYGVKTFSYIYNKDLYKRVSHIKYHAVFTTYIMFVFMVIVIFLGPLSLLDNKWGEGPGSIPDSVSNHGNGTMSIIENIFVHVATPLIVLYDYFKTKHDKEEVESLSMKYVIIWQIYFVVYFIFTNIMGAVTGIFLYSIVDFNYWGWLVVIFYPSLILIYWGLIAIVIFVKKYWILKEEVKHINEPTLISDIGTEIKPDSKTKEEPKNKLALKKDSKEKPKPKTDSKDKLQLEPKKEPKTKVETKPKEKKEPKETSIRK